MARVVLAMSGGVDSSVAAHLLRREGHEVIGLFMRHGQAAEATCEASPPSRTNAVDALTTPAASLPILAPHAHKQGCCTASDALDARRVADRLGIAFYAVNFEAEFGRIIDYFVDEYTAGRTPNPCVVCNNWLKFGRLAEYADDVGAEFLATGHYARLSRDAAGQVSLERGLDGDKDQSYVLFGIDRDVLPRVLLPVGGFRKPEIRAMARELGLRVAEKKDSQEICFVSAGEHADFVRRRRSATADDTYEIVTVEGRVVGRHEGIEHFTIGQRKGLGVAFGEPRYVVRIEAETNRVVVGTKEQLARDSFSAARANWLIDPPTRPFACEVKIRYRSAPARGTITPLSDQRFEVRLDRPTHGVAPGQAAVCYDGERVLGGGWIE